MQGDDPPYLSVGTAVSAKYKGAFCEAKVSKVVRIVKCKVTYKMGLGTATVSDEHVKGTLRVGQSVQVKHPDRKDFVEATIAKIQDCSQYTVVFDDGDITTLRRTALCLKSGRHFNESETLDQLPLTHPEHFGNPVMGGRGARGRRSRQLKEDSSEGEAEEENEPDLEMYSADIGRVVIVESSEKKRNKDNWFPGLIVVPSAQPTVKINVKDEFLVRSFKDGRYYTVPKKEVLEFSREMGARVESNILADAVDKVVKYLDEDELPLHWEKSLLFNTPNQYSDSEENFTDSSDDEPREEKDHFVAQLYKFMDDSGTPLNKSPMIGSRDVDLYRLFRIVHKLGGYNRVTNQNKWRTVTVRLKFSNSQNICNQVKMVYKKCLFSYESFYRTLGCTMSDHTRSAKKNRGRSLIRDRDRVTPVQSPRPEKDDVPVEPVEKKEEEEKGKVKKAEIKKIDDEKKRPLENTDANTGENTDQIEPVAGTSKDNGGRPKRVDVVKGNKDKKAKVQTSEKPKVVEKPEETKKEEKEKEKEDEKVQQTRSKGLPVKPKELIPSPDRKTREQKTPMRDVVMKVAPTKVTKKAIDDEKKRGRKRINTEDKSNSDSTPEPTISTVPVNVGDKLKVYYGPTHESRAVTYEAKVIEIDNEAQGPVYMVHYTGWNTRYDEWITPQRIAENLSATTKAKRLKQGAATSKITATTATTSATTNPTPSSSNTKPPSKRGRGTSITGKSSTSTEPPRSTTPSSIASSSGRTKSPATPVTTRNSRITRQGESNKRTRRISVQTDISLQSDSDSGGLESESEQSRTRSGNKSEDSEAKPMRKKLTKTKGEKRKDDDDTEKEEEVEKPKKTLRKLKKSLEPKPTDESDDDNINLPKGRDFDLNQIRSELKGITKLKLHSAESSEKDTISSDDSTTPDVKPTSEEDDDKKEKIAESTSSSEDVYEFKEPEPFDFESHKIADDKNKKRFVPRILESIDKSPKKKSPKSITKKEVKDEDKKKFKSLVCVNKDEEDEFEDEKEIKVEDIEDPFDKLVESPSFHIGKSTAEKSDDYKKVTKILNLDSPLGLFKELPLIEDDVDERLEISDTEDSPNEPLFTHKEQLFTNAPFSKSSPNSNIDSDCVGFTTPKSDDRKPTTSDDEDLLETTMKNVLSFDNDSNDALLLNQSNIAYESPKQDELLSKTITLNTLESEDESKTSETFVESKDTQEKIASLSRQIAPVFQESDSTLLKDLYVPQFSSKSDNLKDISVKTGTKIADSILQKFSMIKNKDSTSPIRVENIEDKDEETVQTTHELQAEPKTEQDEEKEIKDVLEEVDDVKVKSPEMKLKTPSPKEKYIEAKVKSSEKFKDIDVKKRPSRKCVSKEFIEESDTDSSDSDERLIMDEDSQTSMSLDMKPDTKESDSNASFTKRESPEIEEEPQRNFKFDTVTHNEETNIKEDIKMGAENIKEDEPDSHSLLWCEETIPGSPAPPSTELEIKPKKNELEMPFASVPCSSTSSTKNLLNEIKNNNKDRIIPPPLAINLENQETRNASSAVLDNTPPTTPESTLSNLSPRGENDDLSPNTADNESCKSTEAENDYPNLRRGSSNKVSPYSEEDTLMNSESGSKKSRDDILPSPCKKRRRSCKGMDDIPSKRGRKPNNRSRHNSDSDDISEHSVQGSTNIGLINNIDTRLTRSPRPSKYNFFVEFDPSLDSTQRIAVLQQKLTELRKTYANVKAELATIERRRKKIRRREREDLHLAFVL